MDARICRALRSLRHLHKQLNHSSSLQDRASSFSLDVHSWPIVLSSCKPPGCIQLRKISPVQARCMSTSLRQLAHHGEPSQGRHDGAEIAADAVDQAQDKQARRPWHREGLETPPAEKRKPAKTMTKGKLLTTPSRLLKLILPIRVKDEASDSETVEPLALLVHPQQPLSYLERLIQSEIPTIRNSKGQEKIPSVHFRAKSPSPKSSLFGQSEGVTNEDDLASEKSAPQLKDDDAGKTRTGGEWDPGAAQSLRDEPGEGGVESYSGLGREDLSAQDTNPKDFVRWSTSTEAGDFIRDAARGAQFAIEIEGMPEQILVAVPSFNDRTHYLRMRLRKVSKRIASMASLKRECDLEAHKGAQRVAMGGFGLLVSWWALVYWMSFKTTLGWDMAEPITYLVGLTTVMGGYLWFLYHNREVSYRSALNLTISRRQAKLYQLRGFDPDRWQALVDEANALRKEIKAIADEYDVDWDERQDEQNETVTQALEEEREKEESGAKRAKQRAKATASAEALSEA